MDVRKDDDYARMLMREIENDPEPFVYFGLEEASDGDDLKRYFHLQLLVDAGYLAESGRHGGTYRLTMAGCDFLDNTRSDERWDAAKAVGKKVGDVSLRMLGDIAVSLVKAKLADLGLM